MLWSIVAAQPSPSQAGFCIDMDFGQHPNLPPSKSDKTQYLLTGATFEFAVKTKKFLGGCAEGPLTVPRQFVFWPGLEITV